MGMSSLHTWGLGVGVVPFGVSSALTKRTPALRPSPLVQRLNVLPFPGWRYLGTAVRAPSWVVSAGKRRTGSRKTTGKKVLEEITDNGAEKQSAGNGNGNKKAQVPKQATEVSNLPLDPRLIAAAAADREAETILQAAAIVADAIAGTGHELEVAVGGAVAAAKGSNNELNSQTANVETEGSSIQQSAILLEGAHAPVQASAVDSGNEVEVLQDSTGVTLTSTEFGTVEQVLDSQPSTSVELGSLSSVPADQPYTGAAYTVEGEREMPEAAALQSTAEIAMLDPLPSNPVDEGEPTAAEEVANKETAVGEESPVAEASSAGPQTAELAAAAEKLSQGEVGPDSETAEDVPQLAAAAEKLAEPKGIEAAEASHTEQEVIENVTGTVNSAAAEPVPLVGFEGAGEVPLEGAALEKLTELEVAAEGVEDGGTEVGSDEKLADPRLASNMQALGGIEEVALDAGRVDELVSLEIPLSAIADEVFEDAPAPKVPSSVDVTEGTAPEVPSSAIVAEVIEEGPAPAIPSTSVIAEDGPTEDASVPEIASIIGAAEVSEASTEPEVPSSEVTETPISAEAAQPASQLPPTVEAVAQEALLMETQTEPAEPASAVAADAQKEGVQEQEAAGTLPEPVDAVAAEAEKEGGQGQTAAEKLPEPEPEPSPAAVEVEGVEASAQLPGRNGGAASGPSFEPSSEKEEAAPEPALAAMVVSDPVPQAAGAWGEGGVPPQGSDLPPGEGFKQQPQLLWAELTDRERLGQRGEWLFAAQVLVGALIAFPPEPLQDVFSVLGGATVAAGLGLLYLGQRDLTLQNLTPLTEPRPANKLVTTGVFGFVRHPMYGGLLLLCLGWGAASGEATRLLLTGVLALVLRGKVVREEAALEAKYPEEYPEYKRSTKQFIPFIW